MNLVKLDFPDNFSSNIAGYQRLNNERNWARFYGVIKYVGLTVAAATAIGGAITLSSVLTVTAFVATGATVIGHILRIRALVKVRELETRPELTPEARAETCAEFFLKNIEKGFDFYKNIKLINKSSRLYPCFLRQYYDSTTKNTSEFAIEDKNLEQKTKLKLMLEAMKNDTVIHFRTLEKRFVNNKELEKLVQSHYTDKKPLKEAVESVSLSLAFIMSCMVNGVDDVEKINRQLQALSPKILYNASDARKSHPLVQMEDESTIAITSYKGEFGDLESVVAKFNEPGYTLKIYGQGFNYLNGIGEEKWTSYFSFVADKTSLRVIDCTHVELEHDCYVDQKSRYPLQPETFKNVAKYVLQHPPKV